MLVFVKIGNSQLLRKAKVLINNGVLKISMKIDEVEIEKIENENNENEFMNELNFFGKNELKLVKCLINMKNDDLALEQKTFEVLKSLYDKMPHEDFMRSMMLAFQALLKRNDDDDGGLKGLKFIAKFVAEYGELETQSHSSHPIIISFFRKLLEMDSPKPDVKRKICKMAAITMSLFSEKTELDESIIKNITERMLYFTKDICGSVRVQAILALQRLQNAQINDDPITKTYLFHLRYDSDERVRMIVLETIHRGIQNLSAIIEKINDEDEDVRKLAYVQLKKYFVLEFKAKHRGKIIRTGFIEESNEVKEAMIELIMKWIEDYEFDYVEFLRGLEFDCPGDEDFEEYQCFVLNQIFRKTELKDINSYLKEAECKQYKKCLHLEDVSVYKILIWKEILKFKKEIMLSNANDKKKLNSRLPKDFPEISILCSFIENFANEFDFGSDDEDEIIKNLNFNDCMIHLFQILDLYEFENQKIDKDCIQQMLKSLLVTYETNEKLMKVVKNLMQKMFNTEQEIVKFLNVRGRNLKKRQTFRKVFLNIEKNDEVCFEISKQDIVLIDNSNGIIKIKLKPSAIRYLSIFTNKLGETLQYNAKDLSQIELSIYLDKLSFDDKIDFFTSITTELL